MKKLIAVIVVLAGLIAYAVTEKKVDKYAGAFPVWFNNGLYVGPNNPSPIKDTKNKVTRLLAGSATVDFASATVGRIESTGITVTGARANDECTVGENATAGALKADFSCYVSAADTVKIRFEPKDQYIGTLQFDGASPGADTATVKDS